MILILHPPSAPAASLPHLCFTRRPIISGSVCFFPFPAQEVARPPLLYVLAKVTGGACFFFPHARNNKASSVLCAARNQRQRVFRLSPYKK